MAGIERKNAGMWTRYYPDPVRVHTTDLILPNILSSTVVRHGRSLAPGRRADVVTDRRKWSFLGR